MLKAVTRTGYKLFGKYVHKYYTHFRQLVDSLKTARMPILLKNMCLALFC